MLVIHDALHSTDLPRGGVGTVGSYDGIHRGQRSVLDLIVARARALGVPSVVVTFDPHPLAVLRPEGAPPRLTTAAQKELLLDRAGVDAMVVLRFTRELSEWPARLFVRDFLHRRLGLREIYVGAEFVFGYHREGDLALLQELGRTFGFAAFPVPEVAARGERVSSTRIRRLLGEGRIEEANELLGRAYEVSGVVVRGDRMGRKLGFPTINLQAENELVPADGVYAGSVQLASFPTPFECAVNVGTRPTVYEHHGRVVEAHILDFDADVYGDRAALAFHKRLREERTFPSVVDLAAQIGRDVAATREHFHSGRRATVAASDDALRARGRTDDTR